MKPENSNICEKCGLSRRWICCILSFLLFKMFMVVAGAAVIAAVMSFLGGNSYNSDTIAYQEDLISADSGLSFVPEGASSSKEQEVPRPPGVILEATGGIGDQMFQYACSYALSRELNWPLFVYLDKSQNSTFALNMFNIPRKHLVNHGTKRLISSSNRSMIEVDDKQLLERSWSKKSYEEMDDDFHEESASRSLLNEKEMFVKLRSGCNCSSLEYWTPYEPEIRRMFHVAPKFLQLSSLQPLLDTLHNTESVIVYISGEIPQNLQVPKSFQRLAIRQMIRVLSQNQNGVHGPVFFVFSDDPSYAEDKFQDFNQTFRFVHVSKELRKLINDPTEKNLRLHEFYLMTQGKHIIVPASSVGWWAAYLLRNKDKVVIASTFNPEYFHKEMLNFYLKLHGKLFYPKSWIVIDPFSGGLLVS